MAKSNNTSLITMLVVGGIGYLLLTRVNIQAAMQNAAAGVAEGEQGTSLQAEDTTLSLSYYNPDSKSSQANEFVRGIPVPGGLRPLYDWDMPADEPTLYGPPEYQNNFSFDPSTRPQLPGGKPGQRAPFWL